MYPAVLTIHSWCRWLVLLLGAAATVNAFLDRGGTGERPRGLRWDWLFMMAFDVQILLGLLLYFGLSPYSNAGMSNVSLALRDPALRFWTFTHVGTMVAAIVAVRAGRVFAMGEPTTPARRNGRFLCFGIAVLAMMAGVPWPGMALARPLFRF